MRKSFIHGALILMAAASVNRVVGFIYQAVIYRKIGAEGVGLFNLVYPVYVLIIVIATAGIPLGISKLVSEEEVKCNHRRSYQILWFSVSILVISGALFSCLSYMISPLLLKYVFVNKVVYRVFLCLVPGVFVVSVSSAFRGFFQGMMNMKIPALGQVLEQAVRVSAGLYLATALLPRGIDWAAAGLAAASVAGEVAGLCFMLAAFLKEKPLNIRFALPGFRACRDILRKLSEMCAPITLGRIAATVMLSIDSVLVPSMLKKAGFTTSAATEFYGQFTGMALTLLFVPSVITVSLAISLVPAVSEAVAQERPALVRNRTREALRVTFIAGIPFIAAFLTLPEQLTMGIYGSPEGGKLLSILALGGMLAYFQQTTTGILQGLGHPGIPLQNLLLAGVIKIAGIYLLTPVPSLGIVGCAYAYNLFYLIAAGLNLHFLKKRTGFNMNIGNDFIKPITAGFAAGFLFVWLFPWLRMMTGSHGLGLLLSLSAGFLTYLAGVICLGSVTRNDLAKIPSIGGLISRKRF